MSQNQRRDAMERGVVGHVKVEVTIRAAMSSHKGKHKGVDSVNNRANLHTARFTFLSSDMLSIRDGHSPDFIEINYSLRRVTLGGGTWNSFFIKPSEKVQ